MQQVTRTVPEPIPFRLFLASDHATPAGGRSPTVTIRKPGGVFAAPVGAVAETDDDGSYVLDADVADVSEAGPLLLHAEASGCDPADVLVAVRPNAGTPAWQQHSTAYTFPMLILAADGITGLEGENAVFERRIGTNVHIVCDGTVAEVGYGWYELHPGAGDVAEPGTLELRARAAGSRVSTFLFDLGGRPDPTDEPDRDSSVWQTIADALTATGAFSVVRIGERPGTKAASPTAETPEAVITPEAGEFAHLWSDGGLLHSEYTLSLTVSDDDESARFRQLDRLHAIARAALDGESIGGLTVAALTYLDKHKYAEASHPLKRLELRGDAPRLAIGDTPFDTSEDEGEGEPVEVPGFGDTGDDGFGASSFGDSPFGGVPDPTADDGDGAGFAGSGFGAAPFGF